MIEINLDKAIDITKERLRRERAPLLAKLDIQSQRNLESGKDNSEVIAEKQRLRDITKLAEGCSTPEELAALTI
ncbi:MAG: hypothetical protein OEL57_14240 [Trichlorobacter sp.]|uniref:hypothetical protein n=1 Tax=Trichlorobacter sp. TaxID=2911007 RepID=UPI00256333B9|nr:hypothetical protein [Trichlorobacter sp.]MDK9719042.1 hypothetical protein [Trichlorobacter sp.]